MTATTVFHTVLRALGALLVTAVLFCPPLVPGASAREIYGVSENQLGLYLGNNLLSSWNVPEARALVDRLLAEAPDDPGALALEARVLFFEGAYAASLARLEQLGVEGPFRKLVADTVDATREFRSRASEHFEVFWSNPKDELLVDPALEALERSRDAVAEHLGFVPDRRVRVEIYPTVAAFTAVSTLTEQEVETSGTIGLCKFDRLMITSPRVTLWGYGWRDTLGHEYLHLAQFRLSAGQAPIWVHEGIAKYYEAAWRGELGRLEPSSQALLARRMEEDTLISLEAMSPSVAKLPSAEDTALAFAEVGTMIGFLVEQRGADAPRRLLDALGRGEDDRTALEGVWEAGFQEFDQGWREWVRGLSLNRQAGQVLALELADHGREQDTEPGEVTDPEARDFVRLGDLLRARGRGEAAAVEYAKAYGVAPDSPGIATRHALGRLALGRFEEVVEVTDRALQLYPELAVLWHRRGEALLALGRPDEARHAWQQVMEVNPFHLPARNGLLRAALALGDEPGAAEQERALALLLEDGAAQHGR